MLKKLLLILLVSLLGGCINLGYNAQDPSRQTYVLSDTLAVKPVLQISQPHTLLVEATRSNSYDDNQALVFSRAPHTRGHYQYAHWSELPSVRLGELLFNRLANANLYTAVVQADSDARADLHLSTQLLAFYHDASSNPGQVRIELRAELFDTLHHRLIARRLFEQTFAVKNYNAAGAATAFNLATGALLNNLTTWLASTQQNP